MLGFTLYFDGDLDGAHDAASAGLKLSDPDPYLYYLEAVTLLKSNGRQHAQILSDLAAAEKNIPACALCYVASGKTREQQNNLPGALSDFQAAVKLAPGMPEGWYHLASAYDRIGRKADAAQARERFQKTKANDDEREKEMIRGFFLQSLGAQGPGPR